MLSLPSTSLKIGIQSLVLKTPPMAKSPVVHKRGDWLQGVKQGCLDRTRANEGSRCIDSLIWSLTDNSFYLIAGTSSREDTRVLVYRQTFKRQVL